MISIIDFGSSKTPAIADSFKTQGYHCVVIPWEQSGLIDKQNTKAYVLSGSPILITEKDISTQLSTYDFLKQTDVPVLGICFGHQLLGMLHGAKIFKGEAVRSETKILIKEQDELFQGFNKNVTMTEDHTEGISLPENFILLASSEKYKVEAMKHAAKKMFGVQFHPEVSGENGAALIKNFCKLI